MNSNYKLLYFFKVSAIALLFLCTYYAQAQIDNTITNRLAPPSEVANYYKTSPDSRVSDDFNGSSIDFNVWDYRNGNKEPSWGMDNNSVYTLNQNGTKFVSIKGINTNNGGLGAGLVSKVPVKYGFYITKWRMSGTGFSTNEGGEWHPSIWGSRCNFAYSPIGDCLPGFQSGDPRIELDFMEGFESSTRPRWDSHIITWGGTATGGKQSFTLVGKTTDWNGWKTLGLEYTPEYLRLWHYINGSWIVKKTIAFTSDLNDSGNHVSDEFRESVYWILSNKPGTDESLINDDSWFHIDYFYFYEHKNNLFTDNGVVNNGTYNIKNVGSNKYLRGYNGTSSNTSGNNAYVTHLDLNSSWSSQKWKFIEDSPGVYKIQNIFSGRFLRAYDPTNSNKDGNNANITVYSNNNWASLKWRVIKTPESSGSYYLQSLLDDSFMRGYDPDGAITSGNGSFATKRQIVSSASSFHWKLELASGSSLTATTAKTALAIQDEDVSDFKIYPNPASTTTTIESQSNQKIITIEVINALGQNTLTKANLSLNKYILDVSEMPRGLYFIKTYLEDGNIKMSRLLVN